MMGDQLLRCPASMRAARRTAPAGPIRGRVPRPRLIRAAAG
jgi:hypothetical protein